MSNPSRILAYYVHNLDPQVFHLSRAGVNGLCVLFGLMFLGCWTILLVKMFHQSAKEGVLGLSLIYAIRWGWENRAKDLVAAALFAWAGSVVGLFILLRFDPIGWGPRWYGLAYLMGFLCAYLLLKKNARNGMLRLKPERVADMVLNCCIFGVLVGGRLGFVLFYDLPNSLKEGRTPLLWDFSPISPGSSIPFFWGVLKVWDGGMSAHGGIVFTILTLFWFSRKYKSQGANFINLGDASCMVVPVGLFFGRIANFINGELYGHPTTVPWAVKFPSEIYSPTNGRVDVAALDLSKLPADFVGLRFSNNWYEPNGAATEALEKLQHGVATHDPAVWSKMVDAIPARHPSQLYEALLEGFLLFAICYIIGRRWKKDGMASGAFLTFYPITRIIGEQFRVGDTPLNIMGMDISKGVLYSLPLAIAGAIYWAYFIRTSKPNVWQPQIEAPEPDKEPDKKAAKPA